MLAAVGVTLALSCNAPCRGAGWISEIWPQPTLVTANDQLLTLPPLIEVTALDPQVAAELVIIDARDSIFRYGLIKRRFTLSPGHRLRVLSEASIPLGAMGINTGIQDEFEVTPNGQTLDLTGSRAVLLTVGGSDSEIGTVIDAVTIGPTDVTRPHADFPARGVLTPQAGQVITRPNIPTLLRPYDNLYLIAEPGPTGWITGDFGGYRMNPGLINVTWAPPPVTPEPASMAVLAWTAVLLGSRRKHPATTPGYMAAGAGYRGNRGTRGRECHG